MRCFSSVLLLASVASAQSTSASLSASASASGSSSLSAELAAIPECNTTQLNGAQTILQSNQREAQCEQALSLSSGTMLQVTTTQASEMCDTASCKAALQELYNELPNCRYNLWGLQHSAEKLLEYCGITPTNTTDSESSSGSAGWSVVKSNSASFASAGADSPSTTSSTAEDNSASAASSGSSAASATTTVSAVLAATAGIVAAFLA